MFRTRRVKAKRKEFIKKASISVNNIHDTMRSDTESVVALWVEVYETSSRPLSAFHHMRVTSCSTGIVTMSLLDVTFHACPAESDVWLPLICYLHLCHPLRRLSVSNTGLLAGKVTVVTLSLHT
jgi:hypothetical protein